jgi:SAM-dependent methyltransferase
MQTNSIAFDRAAGYYDETRGFPPGVEKGVAELINRVGNFTRQNRVLEIGVGTVGVLVGVDLSRPMLARLKAKQTNEPVYVMCADATRLPFGSYRFDGAVAVHVFHLIPNWRGVLSELARVLKPGATLLHGWGDPDIFKPLSDAWRSLLPTDNGGEVGVRFERNAEFLVEEGWRKIGKDYTFTYSYEAVPSRFVERLQNRMWSQTWRLTDEELARGVEAVKDILRRDYPNPDEPLTVSANFHVRAYLPPSS